MFISFARSNSLISLFGYLSSFLGFALLLIACPCFDDALTKDFLPSLFVHFIWKDNVFNKSGELGTWTLAWYYLLEKFFRTYISSETASVNRSSNS